MTRYFQKILSPGAAPLLGGCFIALLMKLEGWLAGSNEKALLLGSMGASAVLVFMFPDSHFSKFRSVVFGHLVSGVVGLLSALWIPDPNWAAGAAVGGAMLVMRFMNCVHPPGGATALVMVIGGDSIHAHGLRYLLNPVLLNALILGGCDVFLRRWRHPPHR